MIIIRKWSIQSPKFLRIPKIYFIKILLKDDANRLKRWARSKKAGLWQTPNPIPPWKWRSEG